MSIDPDSTDSRPIFDRLLESKVKFGKYQYHLYIIVGFIMIADGSEMTALSILLPVLQTEWHITSTEEGLMGSILFIGVFFGSITSGLVADKLGRRRTLIWASFIQFWLGMLSLLINNVFLFILVRGLFGLMIGFTIPIAPTMASELTPTAYRGKGVAIVNFCFTIGKIYSVLSAKFSLTSLTTGNWRMMLFLSSLPSLIVSFGAYFFMKESPRFLIVIKKIDEGIDTINQIGRMNNNDEYEPVTNAEKEELFDWQKKYFDMLEVANYKSLFTPDYKLVTTCLWVIWYLMQFIEMGIVFILPFIINAISGVTGHTDKKGLNDMVFTMLAETPSILVTLSIIERDGFGRKNSLLVVISIVLVVLLSMSFMPLTAFVYLVAVVKLCQKIGYGMLYPLATELYPTIIRIPGFSFASAFGRLGAASMPPVVLILFDITPLAPMFGFAVCAVMILVAVYTLPYDTRGLDLDKKIQKLEEEGSRYYELRDNK